MQGWGDHLQTQFNQKCTLKLPGSEKCFIKEIAI